MADYLVRDGRTFTVNRDHRAATFLDGLADGIHDFRRLAIAQADLALAVAKRDERGELELAPALDHLGHAVDVDHFFLEFALGLKALLWTVAVTASAPPAAPVAPALEPCIHL